MKSANRVQWKPVLRPIRVASPIHWPDSDWTRSTSQMDIATTAPDAAQNAAQHAAPTGFNGTLTDKLREQFAEGLDGQTLRADFTMQQPVHRYTAADHATWRTLYDRQ